MILYKRNETFLSYTFTDCSVESIGHVVGVCFAHPEDGGGEIVVVGGVPVVLGHQANSAPPGVASTALA